MHAHPPHPESIRAYEQAKLRTAPPGRSLVNRPRSRTTLEPVVRRQCQPVLNVAVAGCLHDHDHELRGRQHTNRADLGHLPDVFVDGDIWEELRVELEAAKVAGSVAPDALVVLLTSTAATCFSSESLSGRGRLRCRPKKGSMLLSSAPNEGTDEGPGDERLTVFLLLSLIFFGRTHARTDTIRTVERGCHARPFFW